MKRAGPLCICFCYLLALSIQNWLAAEDLPSGAKALETLSSEGIQAFGLDQTLWLKLSPAALEKKQAKLPRLCAPIRSLNWKGKSQSDLKFTPEQTEWIVAWQKAPDDASIIEVVCDSAPWLPKDCPIGISSGDGSVMLHAFQASTVGQKLRFEPQWYKNTVGYWTVPTDYATWEFKVEQPGAFSVAVLQGCGEGQGGSDALLTVRQGDDVKSEMNFQTIDTGHFQNFRWNHLGKVQINEAGTYQLRIEPKRIAKAALFDVRAIHLVRQAK